MLVVDDDPAVHDVLRQTLVKEGYRLLHAYDGAEALKIAHDDPPDVITLDVMMPQLDGWTVLGKLKSDPELAHIPVIMLTIVDERTMGYSLGAAEYMTKPVDRARLIELLRRFAAQDAAKRRSWWSTTTRDVRGDRARRRSRRPGSRSPRRATDRPRSIGSQAIRRPR